MATKDKGNVAVREAWESGVRTRAKLDSFLLVKIGKYAALEAIQPQYGDEPLTGYIVESSVLTPRRGLMGELRIQLVEKDISVGTRPLGALKSTFEIDMAQLEKPIMSKPVFSGYAPQIDLWRNASAELRSQYKYLDADGAEQTLSGEALTAARLILKGTESYLCFYPVVMRTSIYKARPTPADYGKICTPPITAPGAWVYLKTSDRIMQQTDRNYVRTEQWTGADEWSTDLYETA